MGPTLRLEGTALHRGVETAVVLARREGPLVIEQRGASALLESLVPSRTDRGLALRSADGRVAFDLAEHLLAALGGLGITQGIRIRVEGDEVPLLDGGARRFVEALAALGAPRGRAPRLHVAREATFEDGASTYRFAPGAHVRVGVFVAFRAPVGEQRAAWDGDPTDFAERIAPARTFGWLDEHEALLVAGRARAVDPASVVVFGAGGPLAGGRPPEPDEAARHKLLDLVGDLTLYGGPPRGEIEACRPGHGATHAVVARALSAGVLVRTREASEEATP